MGKRGNKSFVDVHSVSRRNLVATRPEADNKASAYQSAWHKTAERRELFDKHFSKVLLSSNKYRDKAMQDMFGHPLAEEYANAPFSNVVRQHLD